jgi:ABC-type polysaccharide/polyol phosphate transport system ATPase subunit
MQKNNTASKLPMHPDHAIEVEGVWKSYRTGSFRGSTLLREIRSWLKSLRSNSTDADAEVLDRVDLSADSMVRNTRFWAVQDVSFSVKKGEVVMLLGVNGAGKSTLMQILCHITDADRGVVRIRGKIASLLGAGVGFNDEMTGRENVYLNGAILGMQPAEITAKMDAIAEFAEIPQFMDSPVKRYSSGMKSRLGFSVAVHLDSEVMILDEVFATGDRIFRMKCIDRMKELARSGRTILIVTHMPEMLKDACERGIVLEEGRLIHDGNIDEAYRLYCGAGKALMDEGDKRVGSFNEDRGVSIGNCGFVDESGDAVTVISGNGGARFRFEVTFHKPFDYPDLVLVLASPKAGLLARLIPAKGLIPDRIEAPCSVSGFITLGQSNLQAQPEGFVFYFRVLARQPKYALVAESVGRFDVLPEAALLGSGLLRVACDWELITDGGNGV